MKSLVIYDSNYGNTKKIAETIAKVLEAKVKKTEDVTEIDLKDIKLLVVGSPIIGWKPSEKTNVFLSTLKDQQLMDVMATTFDTRIRLFIHGDAAHKIAAGLKNAGAGIIAEPAGFLVKGTEGPLLAGETEKAISWAKLIKERAK